jgi:hypothetical protein
VKAAGGFNLPVVSSAFIDDSEDIGEITTACFKHIEAFR